ncbi:MAG: dynamin family protein [Gammaproteobacteria bacterium]|nr:dynamin family protein [Gammaproteobacteria bacterium]
MNSKEFELKKMREIKGLNIQNEFIEKLLSGNGRADILTDKNEADINVIYEASKKYLHKLESNEFEIAIVGLEKAGKSTFANALIESDVLPSAPERCTFTSTRLVSGGDKATVHFYGKDEFDDIFKNLLEEIEYPDFENQSHTSLSSSSFDRYFEQLEDKNPQLFKNHAGKTDEEIKDILSCRDRLTLTGKSRVFSGEDLQKDVFKSYIKGDNKGADTSKPRSVKSIEIESSNLKQLESAVIYDVPGFDSPTKIHLRQTEERLKKADAIILVTNAGRNPSLQGTTLSVINKNTDEDGIPLKDKLFVFGNQIDTANSAGEAEGNKKTLIKDVLKYKIGEKKRVFVGSALKYLVDNGIVKKEFKGGFEVESGIGEIRKELIFYYENERFQILKRKIDSNKNKLKSVFQDVLNVRKKGFDDKFSENERARILRGSWKNIEEQLESGLNEFKFKLKHEIWGGKYFSEKLKKDIENFDCFQEINDEFVKNIKMNQDDSLTTDVPVEKINQQIRRLLHKKYLEGFSNLINQMTGEKSREIESRLLDVFSVAVAGEADSIMFDEIKIDSNDFIKTLTSGVAHNEGRFTYLIERFSRDVFDVFISSPVLSGDRHDKFRVSYEEILYLNTFYGKDDGSLVDVVLGGELGVGGGWVDKNDINELMGLADEIVSLSADGMSLGSVIRRMKNVKSRMGVFSNEVNSMADSDIKRAIEKIDRSKTEDEVVKEINKDISNLKVCLIKSVVPAVNLELVFFNGVDKQIKLLIESFKSSDSKGGLFDDFISKIVLKVKRSELDGIDLKVESLKIQRAFLEEMEAFPF